MKVPARAPTSATPDEGGWRPIAELAATYLGKASVVMGPRSELAIRWPIGGDDRGWVEAAAAGNGFDHGQVVTQRAIDGDGVVSDHVEGSLLVTLARQLMMRRSEVPLSVLARLGLDLLDGLAALHGQRGYRPGGLSATSVLVGQGGQARWIQPFVFGALAHDAAHGRHPDRVAHASPESLHGGGDARSDLYTLGVLLWELLQQKRRFSGLYGEPRP